MFDIQRVSLYEYQWRVKGDGLISYVTLRGLMDERGFSISERESFIKAHPPVVAGPRAYRHEAWASEIACSDFLDKFHATFQVAHNAAPPVQIARDRQPVKRSVNGRRTPGVKRRDDRQPPIPSGTSLVSEWNVPQPAGKERLTVAEYLAKCDVKSPTSSVILETSLHLRKVEPDTDGRYDFAQLHEVAIRLHGTTGGIIRSYWARFPVD